MTPDLEPRRILLVEDDPNDVLLMRRAFRDTRVEGLLDVVADGDEAIEYLAATGRHSEEKPHHWPALIILDLNLPRRKGHEVLRWLRREAGITQIPVVILTSSVRPEDVRQAYELGANSYLRKPTRHESTRALAETVARYWLEMNVGAPIGDA